MKDMTIVSSDQVRAGKPVIAGTRVAVEDVERSFYDASRSIDEIASDYGITVEQVEEALRYTRTQGRSEEVQA